MRKIILGIALLFFLGGIGYWYFGIYQPSRYAESAVMLYKEWRDGELQILDKVSIIAKEKGVYDYATALETLESLEDFLVQTQTKLSDLGPIFWRGIEKQFGADFLEFLNRNIETVNNAENRTRFVAKAQEYENIFSEKLENTPVIIGDQSVPVALKMKTPEEVWREIEAKIPKAKSIGDALFTEEINRLNGTSFAQLKSAWKEASLAFDILVQTRGQDANAARKVASFNSLIHETVRLNDIYSLLSRISAGDILVFTGDSSQTNSSAPQELILIAVKLNNDLWILLQEYPKLSVGHNIDQLTPSEYYPTPLEQQ